MSPRFAIDFCRCKIAPMSFVRDRLLPDSRCVRARLPLIISLLLLMMAFSGALRAQTDPASTDPRVQELYSQAKADEANGDFAGAVASYESLLKIAPRLAAAYNNLGALYLRHREYKKAAETLEKGLKLDPKMSSAAALLGIARYEMGDYVGARRSLEAVLKVDPKRSEER